MSAKPFLLVDVDGVLNPFARRGNLPPEWVRYDITVDDGRTFPVMLTTKHGRWLTDLEADFELAWATTWEDEANTRIRPLIEFPRPLPVVEVIHHNESQDKFPGISELVGDRPTAWIDDAPGPAGYHWRDERLGRGIPTLIVVPDPAVGFTRAHKDQLHRFAYRLGNPRPG